MKLHVLLLITVVGGAVLAAFNGHPVPAALVFIVYVIWTIVRDASGWRARDRT